MGVVFSLIALSIMPHVLNTSILRRGGGAQGPLARYKLGGEGRWQCDGIDGV